MKEQRCTHKQFWKCPLQVNPNSHSMDYPGQLGVSAGTHAETLSSLWLEIAP